VRASAPAPASALLGQPLLRLLQLGFLLIEVALGLQGALQLGAQLDQNALLLLWRVGKKRRAARWRRRAGAVTGRSAAVPGSGGNISGLPRFQKRDIPRHTGPQRFAGRA
jgi:hypothetical protein